jgi:DNA-binding NtrC family response regulator
MRHGANDYLLKPINFAHLRGVLSRVARPPELSAEVKDLRSELRSLGHYGRLVGGSAPMQRLYDQIGRVAPTGATVLITGESGTGKEIVAQTIHEVSRRRLRPFLAVNCGAISPHIIESELFGHEKGSFTGANRQHRGYFERAHGGTLFLDEITEMPMDLQVKLLRVLETQTVSRVGSDRPIETDVRVLAASNRHPHDAVAAGKLRKDLLYRLQVFPLHVPPLRERSEDIELLANHFLAQLNKRSSTTKTLTPAARRRRPTPIRAPPRHERSSRPARRCRPAWPRRRRIPRAWRARDLPHAKSRCTRSPVCCRPVPAADGARGESAGTRSRAPSRRLRS